MSKTIACICKDPGGTNGILAVVKELKKMGLRTLEVANGKAVEMLEGTTFLNASCPEAVVEWLNPDVVLTSMCSDGGIGRDLVPILRGKKPVVALADNWAPRLVDSWQDPRFRPNYICVNDEIGASLVVKAWPDFDKTRIKTTGFPMLDNYAGRGQNTLEARERVSKKLGLDNNWPIIVCPVGILNGASIMLREVISVLEEIDENVYFIPRCHPRMAQNAPEEVELWSKALERYSRNGLVANSSACNTPEILEAADVVISEFSTVLLEASVLRKATIAAFYLPVARKTFHDEFGGLMKEPPFMTLGLTYNPKDTGELKNAIESALSKGPANMQIQGKFIRDHVDGKNAQRVAEFVNSLL